MRVKSDRLIDVAWLLPPGRGAYSPGEGRLRAARLLGLHAHSLRRPATPSYGSRAGGHMPNALAGPGREPNAVRRASVASEWSITGDHLVAFFQALTLEDEV